MSVIKAVDVPESDEEQDIIQQQEIKKKRYYVKPADFRLEYYKSIEADEPTRGLLVMFEKIARGWGSKYPNTNKLDLDSYVNHAVTEAWRKWKKFNPQISGNLFAWFTSVIKNDMAQASNKLNHNKHLNISIDALFINQSQL